MTEFLIGADPELFVRDTSGNLVSAHGMIPGNKQEPFKVKGGAVQVDGMALEFNIDPASTFAEFNGNIESVLAELKGMIPKGYTFDFSPVAQFGKDYIDSQPDEAKELGCEPDFGAWEDGAINPKPNGDLGFRTASGHIHVGWTKHQDVGDVDHLAACIMLSKQLDVSLGVISRLWDRDEIRSEMYGKLGAFRPKHYGVEYRTLSNVWVKDKDTRYVVYHLAMVSAQALMGGQRYYEDYDPIAAIRDSRGDFASLHYYVNSIIRNRVRHNPISRDVMKIADKLYQNELIRMGVAPAPVPVAKKIPDADPFMAYYKELKGLAGVKPGDFIPAGGVVYGGGPKIVPKKYKMNAILKAAPMAIIDNAFDDVDEMLNEEGNGGF